MEQNVIKTIREAFKMAYTNKILKESSEDMARYMDPNELRKAEAKYPSWVSGRLPLRWGATKLGDAIENYLVEKAVEEYKQSGDKKIQDALSLFYYPYERSKIYNYLKKDVRIIAALRKRYKEDWQIAFDEVALNAWTQSIGDVRVFDEVIKKYVKDSRYGIGPLLLNDLKLETLRLAMKSSAVRRGGDSGGGDSEYIPTVMKSLDEPGLDSDGGRQFDLPGDTNSSLKSFKKELSYEKMNEMITDFGNQAVDYFKSKGKEKIATLAREYFVERMENDEIYAAHPDWYEGKNVGQVSTDLLQGVLLPAEINALAERIGLEYGFPKNWLENVKKTKSLSVISKLFKDKYEDKPGDEEDDKEDGKEDDLIFEKFIQKNMDKIMKEVQRRISK
jgi:hypothetical protein